MDYKSEFERLNHAEKTAEITRQHFDSLLEYSASNPTGVVIGKQWKRCTRGKWYLCEYISTDNPDMAAVSRKTISIVEVSPVAE